MIDRLRKDLNDVGSYNPGMAEGGMVEHDDAPQDMDMIAQVLHKIADDMQNLEASRFHPDEKMNLADGSLGVEHPTEDKAETPMEAEPENQSNQQDDPEALKSLLDQAGKDEEHEDYAAEMHDLPPEVAVLIKEKKKSV